MRTVTTSALPIAGVLVCAVPALAQAPVALVEEVRGRPTGIEFMDYVSVGKVIKLGGQDSIALGYLRSCWYETITGGTVIVGIEQSNVQGGKVTRTKVACDGGKIALTGRQAQDSAGTIFRSADEEPLLTLYGLSPFVEATGGDALLIERTDGLEEVHIVTLPARQGTRRSFYDFATAKKRLTAGGSYRAYRASIGSREIFFRIDPGAKPSGVPIISRLLRIPPAS